MSNLDPYIREIETTWREINVLKQRLADLMAEEHPTGVTVGARVYNSANISIANVTTTVLTFNSERFDTDNIHSTVSNTDRLTAPVTGTYLITGHVSFAANATGLRFVEIVLNAAATPIAIDSHDAVDDGTNATIVSVAVIYNLTAGDYVRLRVYQDSGGALNVLAVGNYSPEFSMVQTIIGDPAITQYTDEMAQDAIGVMVADTATIDLTYTDATPALSADVKDNSITYAKMQDVSATDRVLGRDTVGAGDVEEITPAALRAMINVADGANNYVHPNHTGDVTSIGDGATTIAADAVTNAKSANMAANTIKGRITASTGDPEDLTATNVRTILNTDGLYVKQDGTTPLTADWDIGEDRRIKAEALRARDTEGLRLENSAGALGIFIRDADGWVGIGGTPTHLFSVVQDGAGVSASAVAYGAGFEAAWVVRSINGSEASPSATLSGNIIGSFYFQGYDTAPSNGARIYAVAAADWGTAGDVTDDPTDIRFATVPDGSGTLTDRVAILSDGNVGINETAPTAQLQVEQTSTTAAKPTLRLQQADLSEEFIRFDATIGAGNPIDTAAIGTYYGKLRVYVEGVGAKWIALYNS